MAAPAATKSGHIKSSQRPLKPAIKRMPFPLSLYQTSVGKKWVMGITGLMLIGFVIAHLIGNLKLYIGAVDHDGQLVYDADLYAAFLRRLLVPILPNGVALWLLRAGLIAAFGLHIHSAYSLTRTNLKAGQTYRSKQDWLAANFASRTMRYSGIIVGLYLLFHLADLTWGKTFDSFEHGSVQHNVVTSLQRPLVAAIYMVATIALSIHIYHGIYSMFQTLGINNPHYNYLRRHVALATSAIICVGNLSFPVMVLAGVISHDPTIVANH